VPGSFTDDTQLSMAIAKSLILAKNYNFQYIIDQHIVQYDISLIGWGGTKDAVLKLKEDLNKWKGKSGNKNAIGNGPIMKATPLAYFYANQDILKEEKIKQIEEMTRMTHDNNYSVSCCAIHVLLMEYLFREVIKDSNFMNTIENRKELLKKGIEIAEAIESKFPMEKEQDKNVCISKRFKEIIELKELTDEKIVEISNGGNYHAANSSTFVWCVLYQEKPSWNSVLKAIELGGDTDTNASMVGSVVGFCCGIEEIPAEHIEKLQKRNEIDVVIKEWTSTFDF